jgi:diacylglycerol kinase family enzyme
MDRRTLCLIVNPSAGRGRAARLLPRVEQALRARGLRFRVERTE